MSPLNLLLNVLWIVFGGVWTAVAWLVAALIMAITIIGLPWARAALTIAAYTFLPFGHRVVDRPSGAVMGVLGVIGNIVWPLLAGWWLALLHLATALLLAITLIGIPFAWAHLKLAGHSLWPIGRDIVPTDAPHGLSGRPIRWSVVRVARPSPNVVTMRDEKAMSPALLPTKCVRFHGRASPCVLIHC
jgi:uncharacterized membrane protein YccF (DUF307 family)